MPFFVKQLCGISCDHENFVNDIIIFRIILEEDIMLLWSTFAGTEKKLITKKIDNLLFYLVIILWCSP